MPCLMLWDGKDGVHVGMLVSPRRGVNMQFEW